MSNTSPAAPRKLSEALIAAAQPLVRAAGGEVPGPVFLELLRITSTIWNAVLYERVHGVSGVLARLEGTLLPAGTPLELHDALGEIIHSRRREEPLDTRWIGDVQLITDSAGRQAIQAVGAPLESLSKDEVARVFERLNAPLGRTEPRPPAQTAARGRTTRNEPAPSRKLTKKAAALKLNVPKRLTSKNATQRTATPDSSTQKDPTHKGAESRGRAGAEPWRSLYRVARALHELAPWRSHLDSDVFGLRVEGESEVHWCCVMGANGTYYGLALYRGDDAYGVFRRIQAGDTTDVASEGFDGYLFSFLNREDLTAEERRRIKLSGVPFRGRECWPQLERMRAGRLPRAIGMHDASRALVLLDALERVLALRCATGAPAPVDLDGELPVYRVDADTIELGSERPGPLAPPQHPTVDQVAVRRLSGRPRKAGHALEFDVFPAQARVRHEDGWEFAPMVYMTVDATTGFVFPPQLEAAEERNTNCARNLLATLAALESLPDEVRVRQEWVHEAVAPTLAALEIRSVLAQRLPALDEAQASINTFFER